MINIGIIGATGYTGAELVRLLSRHPQVRIEALVSHSAAGQELSSVYKSLLGHGDKVMEELSYAEAADRCDCLFTALPHGLSMEAAAESRRQGKVLIDLGADFRIEDFKTYEEWYKVPHTQPDLLKEAVYGLPELYRERLRHADLIANPGCYPTSTLLGLAPLLREHSRREKCLADMSSIIVDSKSGVTGAGRSANNGTHFVTVNDSFKAYKVASHRHIPEIEQELSKLAGEQALISFTPHLAPMSRGILSTIYINLKQSMTTDEILDLYRDFYKNEQFVKVLPEGAFPETKCVYGSNYCHLTAVADQRTRRAVIVSVIDNLVKGASGQAIQNMNVRFGFPEETALDMAGMLP